MTFAIDRAGAEVITEGPETFAELFKGSVFVEIEAERLRQEGREKGHQESRQEGRHEAEAYTRADMITQLIRIRFGDADDLPQIVGYLIGRELGGAGLETIMAAGSLDDLRY